MIIFHSMPDILSKLKQWATKYSSIRAMLLTSTRAVPNARTDV